MSVDETEEQWRPVVGWEDLYEVSSHGRVRSLHKSKQTTGRILTGGTAPNGYPMVLLCGGGKRVMRRIHGLVAEAFIGPRPTGMIVCHGDGARTNNRVENLRYGTHRDNLLDAVAHGTHGMASKTHCKRGHEFTKANTWHPPSNPNGRACRTCMAATSKLRRIDYSAAEGMLSAEEAGKLLGIKGKSVRANATRNSDFPQPLRISGRSFWDRNVLLAWRNRPRTTRQGERTDLQKRSRDVE